MGRQHKKQEAVGSTSQEPVTKQILGRK